MAIKPEHRPGTSQRLSPARRALRRALRRGTPLAMAVVAALYGVQAAAEDNALEEIIVTATRHSVSAQDIPASITAISGKALEESGITDTAELARSLAGIDVTDKGPFSGVNGSGLIIRGLNSDSTSGEFIQSSPIVQPVATYVDDTPLFFSLRLQDLERVEVLRGPQGTLYGSGSLGGTIRYVQNAPDPAGFDARVETTVSDTAHTHALNYDVSGMLNLPLSESFALRFNAGYSEDAGFIDMPNLYVLDASGAPVPQQAGNLMSPPETYRKDGVNAYQYRSARVSALWKPNGTLHAQLSYFYQNGRADGYPYAAPAYGLQALASTDYIPATSDNPVNLATLTVEDELGFATLTSNTSWAHHQSEAVGDVTSLYDYFPFYTALYGMNPRVLVVGRQGFDDKPWSQEFRLASRNGGATEWVGGLFYKNETTDIIEHDFYPGYLDYYNSCAAIYGQGDGINPSVCGIGETAYTDPLTYIQGIPVIKDQAYIGDFQTHYTDLAAFGEFTWHLSPAWSATGGTRVFRQTVTQSQQTGLLFSGVGYVTNLALSESWSRALWKLNVAYRIDPDNLAYATWSQGFRRGAVNALPLNEAAVGYETPPGLLKVSPDTADNYEIGIKGTLAKRFRYSADIYNIEWHNVQQSAFLTPLALPGAVNVGNAYSRGFETELTALLSNHLSAQLDYTYNETKLTSYNPLALLGLSVAPPPPGSALPGTPKSTAALSLDYSHVPLGAGELRFAASAHYQSAQLPALSASVPTVGGYTMVSARVGYTQGAWQASVYAENLTNELGVTSYTDPIQWGSNYQAIVSTPRTIGLTLAYAYK